MSFLWHYEQFVVPLKDASHEITQNINISNISITNVTPTSFIKHIAAFMEVSCGSLDGR